MITPTSSTGCYATIDLDSNVAIASVSAQGTDTFVGVDAAAIVVEDPLSESTVMITSEVG